MWITKIRLQNVRSFEDETIEFSRGINVLVGPNNSGKSTIAYAALLVQTGFSFGPNYFRLGRDKGNVWVDLEGQDIREYFKIDQITDKLMVQIGIGVRGASSLVYEKGSSSPATFIEARAPMNFIYPYLSKRKVGGYDENVSQEHTSVITGNLQNLYAKIDKVSNPQMPAYSSYVDACKQILGLVVTCSS